MNSFKVTLWIDTELDLGEVASRIEQIELEGVQYQIDKVADDR